MPRRLKLSPLQRDIMIMLEEAGAETVGTVVATLNPLGRPDFDAQIQGLVNLGLIYQDTNNLLITEQGKAALRT